MAVHCPECGFVNPEGANYCQKCGAYLSRPEGGDEPTTMTYKVDETGEMQPVDIDEVVEQAGAALVIRAGGGSAGESFTVTDDRVSIGRTPDAGGLPRRRHRLPQPRAAGPPPRRPLHRRPRIAERHLRQPAPDRVAPARRRRRDPGRQVQAQLPGESRWRCSARQGGTSGRARRPPARRRRPAAAQGADDRRRLQDPRGRVRRHLDLEDPLPRGPEAADAPAHRRGLPPLQPGRRRAPADDPAPAARRVPAAAGDPPGARRRAEVPEIGGRASAPAAAPCGGRSWSTPRAPT